MRKIQIDHSFHMMGIKELNTQIGHHFFSRNTMKFFSSKVESPLYVGGYFITSEKTGFESKTREFKVRKALKKNGAYTGEIDNNPADRSFRLMFDAKRWITEEQRKGL